MIISKLVWYHIYRWFLDDNKIRPHAKFNSRRRKNNNTADNSGKKAIVPFFCSLFLHYQITPRKPQYNDFSIISPISNIVSNSACSCARITKFGCTLNQGVIWQHAKLNSNIHERGWITIHQERKPQYLSTCKDHFELILFLCSHYKVWMEVWTKCDWSAWQVL
jgi:hypothetical protein